MRPTFFAALAGLAFFAACSEPTISDLNNPTQGDYETITDRGQLQGLATGLLNGDRAAYGTEVTFLEIMGRDLYRIDPAENRFITNLLGTNIDRSNFIGSGLWTGPYATIRGADLMITAVERSENAVPTPLSAAEKAAAIGFGRTVKAMEYIRLIEARDVLGIPIETVANQPVPIACKPEVLAYISALLDSAATDLTTAGAISLPFTLPPGFAVFATANATTGPDFLAFNRALKAKVETYRGFLPLQTGGPTTAPNAASLNAALAALDASFYDPTPARAALDVGAYHTYSTASGESTNPLVDLNVFRVNPKVLSQGAEAGDLRIQNKVDTSSSNTTKSLQGISSNILVRRPGAPTDALGVLRNEELILIRAEILWGLNRDAEAVQMLNIVRQVAGLGPLAAPGHQPLLRAILKEKRYSLLFESPSRLVDFRLFGILNELGTERGNNPIPNLPIPNNESVARNGNLTCS